MEAMPAVSFGAEIPPQREGAGEPDSIEEGVSAIVNMSQISARRIAKSGSPFFHAVVVVHEDASHLACHARRDEGYVAVHIRVVG
jgi:hypothetical protein